MIVLYVLMFLVPVLAEWEPVSFHSSEQVFDNIASSGYLPDTLEPKGRCNLFKVAFTQDYYEQYLEYTTKIPTLKEFTLCYWSKFYNHSDDHPVFAYAVHKQPRALYAWISNSEKSSYFSMAIDGQTFYRLNYPLRLRKWYHVCQSWNGKTGEWQVWVNAERVGRGFHNRIVGHTIPSGGKAVSGQELIREDKKDSIGLQGELTMLQLYSVALTAGKAHKDHKHHHAHKFDHNGAPITTTPTPILNPRPSLPSHPLLTGGQINPSVMINIAGPQNPPQPQIVQGQKYNAQYVNGQFVGNLLTEQLIAGKQQPVSQNQGIFQSLPQQNILDGNIQETGSYSSQSLSVGNTQLLSSSLEHPSNYPYVQAPQRLFKRQSTENEKTIKKRELFLAGGSIIGEDDTFGGLATIGENEPILYQQKQNDEREPAEAESKAVMNICTGCDEEPFEKALVFGWRTVPKKLYGATYAPAVPQCKVF